MFWGQCEICEKRIIHSQIRPVRGRETCGKRVCRRAVEEEAPKDLSRKLMSKDHEGHLAEMSGGRVVPGSGAIPGIDADVEWPTDWLVEAKSTGKASISVKRSVWLKIEGEASRQLKRPALALRIQDEDLVAMSLSDFLELTT